MKISKTYQTHPGASLITCTLMQPKRALLASLLANGASFVTGLLMQRLC